MEKNVKSKKLNNVVGGKDTSLGFYQKGDKVTAYQTLTRKRAHCKVICLDNRGHFIMYKLEVIDAEFNIKTGESWPDDLIEKGWR